MNILFRSVPLACLGLLALAPLSVTASDVAKEGAEVGRWTMDFEAASKLAKEKDLPMLLNFTGSDWCGWCQLMDENVYAKPEWQQFAAKQLVLVTLDFPNDKTIVPEKFVARNGRLQEQFKVQGYPTYVILDADGTTELGRLGAGEDKTPASFIEEVNGVLRFRPAHIEAKVSALGPEKGAAYRAALAEVTAARKAFEAWIETGPTQNAENDEKFKGFLARMESAAKALEAF
jgi:thioredoxin-related protein